MRRPGLALAAGTGALAPRAGGWGGGGAAGWVGGGLGGRPWRAPPSAFRERGGCVNLGCPADHGEEEPIDRARNLLFESLSAGQCEQCVILESAAEICHLNRRHRARDAAILVRVQLVFSGIDEHAVTVDIADPHRVRGRADRVADGIGEGGVARSRPVS